MSGSVYGHNHVSVDIVVRFLGWELPLGCQVVGDLFRYHALLAA